MTEGTVRDLHTGRVVGKTRSLEQTFIDDVRRHAARGPCYVVATSDVDRDMGAQIRALGVELIIRDEQPDSPEPGFALILEGHPSDLE